MTVELIISLVSLVLSTACSMMTVFVTLKVGKLNNLEAIHKYQKEINPFELTLRDKKWFIALVKSGEFSNYTQASQQIMIAWFKSLDKNKTQLEAVNTKNKKTRISKNVPGRAMILPGMPFPQQLESLERAGLVRVDRPKIQVEKAIVPPTQDTFLDLNLDFNDVLNGKVEDIIKEEDQ